MEVFVQIKVNSYRNTIKLKIFYSQLKKDVNLIVYENLPHGFLSYDVPRGMKESHLTIHECANILKKLFITTNTEEMIATNKIDILTIK